jgi:hypothetical protein
MATRPGQPLGRPGNDARPEALQRARDAHGAHTERNFGETGDGSLVANL